MPVDSKLVAGLRSAKSSLHCFTLVTKGSAYGALFVVKKPLNSKEINDAKASTGGRIVMRGRCFFEDEMAIFEVGFPPPATLERQLKAIILRDAGMNLVVDVRYAKDLNEDGEAVEPALAPSVMLPPVPPPVPSPQLSMPGARTTTAAAPASNVVFTQVRLAWDQTRKKIQADLQKLEKSILSVCLDPELQQTQFDFSTLAADTKSLYGILDRLDTRLIDKLDDALNAEDPALRKKFQAEADAIVTEYLIFIDGNELMQVIDENGFTPVAVKKTALTALQMLGAKL